jgi:hypothetical protein
MVRASGPNQIVSYCWQARRLTQFDVQPLRAVRSRHARQPELGIEFTYSREIHQAVVPQQPEEHLPVESWPTGNFACP